MPTLSRRHRHKANQYENITIASQPQLSILVQIEETSEQRGTSLTNVYKDKVKVIETNMSIYGVHKSTAKHSSNVVD